MIFKFSLIFAFMVALSGCSDTPPPKTANQDKSPQTALTNEQEHKKNSQQERGACQFLWTGKDFVDNRLMVLTENFYNKHFKQEEFPVRYFIDSDMPEILREPIYEVVSEWNTEIGFEAFAIEGIYDYQIGTTINENDQKNVIYWTVFDLRLYGTALPSQVDRTDPKQEFLIFNETNINLNSLVFDSIIYNQDIMIRFNELYRNFGIQIPANIMEDFEDFQEAGRQIITFMQNASVEQILDINVQLLNLRVDLGLMNDDLQQLRNTLLSISPEDISPEDRENLRSQLANVDNPFTRFSFEIQKDRTKGIIFFKNVLKHEMGHTLGLANIYENDIDLDDFAGQVPLMYYTTNEGFDPDNPESYFDNPLQVDSLTLETLSCIYDLDALRRAHPI